MKIIIYTDGGARGNPGPAAIGVVFYSSSDLSVKALASAEALAKGDNEKKQMIKEYAEYLGKTTNNEAEYQAIIFAFKKAKSLFGKTKVKNLEIECRSDSELVVKQLNHQYKIEEENLQLLFIKIWNLLVDFGKVSFIYIPREKNKEADRLVNQELDSRATNNTGHLFG